MDLIQRNSLSEQLEEAKQLLASRQLPLNADRLIMVRVVRLLETLMHGKPSTPLTPSHNP